MAQEIERKFLVTGEFKSLVLRRVALYKGISVVLVGVLFGFVFGMIRGI